MLHTAGVLSMNQVSVTLLSYLAETHAETNEVGKVENKSAQLVHPNAEAKPDCRQILCYLYVHNLGR